jgi:hypothetical protein
MLFLLDLGDVAKRPNVQAKAARATDEPANQHNARGARSLFGRKLGIVWHLSGSGTK